MCACLPISIWPNSNGTKPIYEQCSWFLGPMVKLWYRKWTNSKIWSRKIQFAWWIFEFPSTYHLLYMVIYHGICIFHSPIRANGSMVCGALDSTTEHSFAALEYIIAVVYVDSIVVIVVVVIFLHFYSMRFHIECACFRKLKTISHAFLVCGVVSSRSP